MYSLIFLVLFTTPSLFSMFEDGDTPNTKHKFLQWSLKESKRLEKIRKQNTVSIFDRKTIFFCKKIVGCSNALYEIIKNTKDPRAVEQRIMEHDQLLARIYDHLEQSLQNCELLNKKLLIGIRTYWGFYKHAVGDYDRYRISYGKEDQRKQSF